MSDEHVNRPWAVDPETLLSLRLQKGEAALRNGEPELALTEAEELLDDRPGSAQALLLSGEAGLALRDAGLARLAFEAVLEFEPRNVRALEGLAVARFELVDFAGALQAARDATAVDPTCARAWFYEGLVLERGEDHAGAQRCFERAAAQAADRFPRPRVFSPAAWDEALAQGRRLLPGPIRAFYARIPIQWEEFPDADELLESVPPLSPFSYALYVGMPSEGGDPWTEPPEALRLFRGNLRHGVHRTDELARRIADALLHEAAAWLGMEQSDLL